MKQEDTVQQHSGFTMGNIGDRYFIHPAHPKDFLAAGEMLTTNESGSFLWEHLKQRISVRQLAETLATAYQIDMKLAEEDTRNFLAQLKKIGAIRT